VAETMRTHRTRLQVAVVAGGIAGALARAGVAEAIASPWSTLAVNVAGTALLGWVVTRLQERLPPSTFPRPALATGFCGALTTFSTLQVELIRLVRDGRAATAAGYLAASLAGGLVGVYLATALTRRVRP
jgi:CrcB protein